MQLLLPFFTKRQEIILKEFQVNLLEYAYKLDGNGTHFPAFISDYKVFEKNNKDIALNILYVSYKEEEIIQLLPEYISNHHFTRKKQMAYFSFTK